MAVNDIGLLGSGSASSAGTTIAVTNTTGATIAAGVLIIISGTWDNIASVTAPTITCSTVGGGTAIANHATAIGSGVTTTAGSGVWHQCFRVLTTSTIASGATIATLTSNQSAVKRVAVAEGFTGCTTTLRNTVATGTSTAGTPTATTTGTALVAGDLVVGTVSGENNAIPTGDADTTNGTWDTIEGLATTGGAAATNVVAAVQDKIVTATGNQTFNPTTANDSVVCVFALVPVVNVDITRSTTWNVAAPPPVAVDITRSTTWDTLQVVGDAPALAPNLITGNDATFESGIGLWDTSAGGVTATLSTVRAHSGNQSALLTWNGTGGNPRMALGVDSVITPGQLYRFSVWVYVPTGSPAVRLATFNEWGPESTLFDTWQRLDMTYTPRTSGNQVWVWGSNNSVVGAQTWVDDVSLVPISSVVIYDGFDTTDSTTGIWNGTTSTRSTPVGGKPWVSSSNEAWGIYSGKAGKNTSSTIAHLTVDSGLSDCVVEVDMTISGAGANQNGILLRYVDENDYIEFVAAGPSWWINKMVGGSKTGVLSNALTANAGQTYRVRVELNGTSMKTYVDNVLAHNAVITDASLQTGTKHGLRSWLESATRWDNFSVNALPSVAVFDPFTASDSSTAIFDGPPPGTSRNTPVGAKPWLGSWEDWGITSNKATAHVNGGMAVVDSKVSDCIVEVDFTPGTGTNVNGLTLRNANDGGLHHIRFGAWNSGTWYAQYWINGNQTDPSGASFGSWTAGTTYKIRAVMNGTNVKIYVDNALGISFDIPTTATALINATYHGLTGASPSAWDNFKITALPTAPTREAEWRTLTVVSTTVPVFDNFDRVVGSGLGVSSSGHTWVVPWGSFSVANGVARASHGGDGPVNGGIAYIESGAVDATVSITKTNAGREGWLLLRYTDDNNFIRFNNSQVVQFVGGVATSLGLYEPAAFGAGDTMTVVMSGGSLTMKKNGVTYATYTTTILTGTKHGIAIWETGGNNEFDNFSVVPAPVDKTRTTTWNVAEPPKTAVQINRSTTWNVLPGIATSSASLTLSGSGTMRASAPAASASLTLSGAGTPQARAAGTASLTLAGTGAAQGPAVSSASLSLTAVGAATASPSSTASLTLSATGTARVAGGSNASLTLSGSMTTQTVVTGTAALTLSGTGVGSSIAAATSTASLSLSASGGATATTAGTASLTLSGTNAAVRAATAAAASLTLTGTGNAGVGRSATASLTLTGSLVAQVRAAGTASLTLTGSGAGRGSAASTASLSLTATGTAVGRTTSFGSLSLTATGTALSQAAITATASLSLNGSAGVSGRAAGSASLSLLAVGAGRGRAAGTASISLTAFAKIVRLDVTVFVGATTIRSSVDVGPTSPQDFIVVGANQNGTVTVGASVVFARVTVGASQLRTFVIVNNSSSGSVVVGENIHANVIVVDNGSTTVTVGPNIHERVR